MSVLARTDTSLVGRWWWTVDRWSLAALIILISIGAVLTLAASPAVAGRLGLDSFYFARRQFAFLGLAVLVMLATSMLSPRGVFRIGMACLACSLVLMIATLAFGSEIKGATRWLQIGAFSLQPSEFVKPGFAVVTAWLFASHSVEKKFPGNTLAAGLLFLVVGLLLMQPDVGMSVVVFAIWASQYFLAGLSVFLMVVIAMLFISGVVAAFFVFPHVQSRISRFFDPEATEGYQVARSLDAFHNGGLFGRGPGEGRVKEVLPDAHADFIFAVAGEEFGLLVCLAIVILFAFFVLRGFVRISREDSTFVTLVTAGLVVQFGLQALINMASTIHLMPPKGMTLPFISYGGSSTLALAYATGMILALTRQRKGVGPGLGGRQ
jgi:cell division protein FtsW